MNGQPFIPFRFHAAHISLLRISLQDRRTWSPAVGASWQGCMDPQHSAALAARYTGGQWALPFSRQPVYVLRETGIGASGNGHGERRERLQENIVGHFPCDTTVALQTTSRLYFYSQLGSGPLQVDLQRHSRHGRP
jgi:hypothetical protein